MKVGVQEHVKEIMNDGTYSYLVTKTQENVRIEGEFRHISH
jgi:hypothetical protein